MSIMARNPDEQELQEISAIDVDAEAAPSPLRQAGGKFPLLSSQPMDAWREKSEERERQREMARAELREREEKIAARQALADGFADAHRGFTSFQGEVLGKMISEVRQQLRAEIAEVRKEVAELRSAARHDHGTGRRAEQSGETRS